MSTENMEKSRIEILESMIAELDGIESRQASQSSELTRQQFIRWKDRNARLMSERFGEDEAQKLSRYRFSQRHGHVSIRNMFSELERPFRESRAFLQSLIDEIKEHGDRYFDEKIFTPISSSVIDEQELPTERDREDKLVDVPTAEKSSKGNHFNHNLEKVTVAWLFHNVPAKFWIWLIGIFIAIFITGISAGQTNIAKDLFGFKTREGVQQPQLSSEEVKNKIDQLIKGHSENVARIQAAILEEEKLTGDHGLSSYDQNLHAQIAQKFRNDLKEENEAFLKAAKELKSFEK
jgi:Skp family chaperone for outer membrane proteins